jgi:hypothetical protein
MIASLTLGTALVLVTFLVHACGLVGLPAIMDRAFRASGTPAAFRQIASVLALILGLFLLLIVEIALWAVAFHWLGFFADFETALYFSTSTFATVGFGDVTPAHDMRLLAAIEGVAGFLIFGWSGAFLVAASVRLGPFRKGVHF